MPCRCNGAASASLATLPAKSAAGARPSRRPFPPASGPYQQRPLLLPGFGGQALEAALGELVPAADHVAEQQVGLRGGVDLRRGSRVPAMGCGEPQTLLERR